MNEPSLHFFTLIQIKLLFLHALKQQKEIK